MKCKPPPYFTYNKKYQFNYMEGDEKFRSNIRMISYFILFTLMTPMITIGLILVLKVSPFSDLLRYLFGFLIGGLYGIVSIIFIIDTVQTHRFLH